jgi:DNA-binding transcriptional MerR regulator
VKELLLNQFTIKDLENLSGIKAHTIRIWEQRYGFIKPGRTKTNIRYYSGDELRTLLNVSLLNKFGFKVSHINKMSTEEVKDKILSIDNAGAQQERLVNEMIQHMINIRMDHFETLLDNFISLKGIEKSISFLIFPFLEKVGILWLTNHIKPAQEHLVSNIIRQKLIVGIDKTSKPIMPQKNVLLFTPEGEYHELGLLYMQYIFKSRGFAVTYLGASVPIKDVVFIENILKPDYLYTHLTSVTKNFKLDHYMANISTQIPSTPLIISGAVAASWNKSSPNTITLKKTIAEVMEFIALLQA